MKGLSKSRYTAFCQCPKILWLKVFKPEAATEDPALQARFEQGNEVGDLAMQLFGTYIDVTTKNPDGSLDLNAMVDLTRQEMDRGTDNICEASFALDGHYCAVDILRRNGDGWDIYEVKSSTYKGEEKDTSKHLLVYTRDIAYQKWLLEQCGLKVTRTYLVRLNKFYVRGKELDIQQLFHIKNMDALVANEYLKVPFNVAAAQKTLAGDEPNEPIAIHCHEPYDCAFFDYCTEGMPTPNVFDLYGMAFKKKCELYNAGKIAFEDLVNEKLNEIQTLQVTTFLKNTELVTPQEIRDFLKNCDLAGYNLLKFDVPLLVEEFLRNDMDFDLRGIRIIDVQNIFHKMEPRTLVAAYKFYCGKPLENAHSAEADARATLEVLESQLDRYQGVPYVDANEVECYPVVNDISKLAFFSNAGHNVDLAGHIIWNNKDQEVFAFGKHKGEPVREVFRRERNYYDWIMKADFPLYTKKVVTRIYEAEYLQDLGKVL